MNSSAKMPRPDKDDVERLSHGQPTRAKIGSRRIGHRPTQKERLLFEVAKRQGFLKIPVTGIRFFPATGVTAASYVGVDDFILVPTVEAPVLSTSVSGGNFVLSFTPNAGVATTIEKLSPDFQWGIVPGTSGLLGSQTFITPVVPGVGLFRVAAREKLTQVTSP